MFDSLDEEIREPEGGRPTTREKLVRYASIAVLSLVVFGGLYFVIVALE